MHNMPQALAKYVNFLKGKKKPLLRGYSILHYGLFIRRRRRTEHSAALNVYFAFSDPLQSLENGHE
jgi:hypothetical protein